MESNRVRMGSVRNLALYNFTDRGVDGNMLVLKSEIDYLQGRNEELRAQLAQSRNDLSRNTVNSNRNQGGVKIQENIRKDLH